MVGSLGVAALVIEVCMLPMCYGSLAFQETSWSLVAEVSVCHTGQWCVMGLEHWLPLFCRPLLVEVS